MYSPDETFLKTCPAPAIQIQDQRAWKPVNSKFLSVFSQRRGRTIIKTPTMFGDHGISEGEGVTVSTT